MSSNDWKWDPHHNQYRIWSPTEGCWVLQDGTRLPTGGSSQAPNTDNGGTHALTLQDADTGARYRFLEATPSVQPHGYAQSHEHAQPSAADQLASAFSDLNVSRSHEFEPPQRSSHPEEVTLDSRKALQRLPREQRKDVEQKLNKRFKSQNAGFFKAGRVFKVLWPEWLGDAGNQATKVVVRGRDEKFLVKIQWFVVFSPGKLKSQCLPINTYDRRGMAKPNLVPEHHAIIHTGNRSPGLSRDEDPKGVIGGRMQKPIQVIPTDKHAVMLPASRLNYKDIQSIDHNCKVYYFGDIYHRDMDRFKRSLRSVWDRVFTLHLAERQREGNTTDDEEPADAEDLNDDERVDDANSGYEYDPAGTHEQANDDEDEE